MGPRIPSHRLEADEKTLAKVAKTRTVLEEHVGQLRARLTEKRSLALERREEVRKVAVEVLRSERKRLRCVKRLRMEEEKEATSALASASGGDGSTGLACAGALSSLPEGTKREEGELFRKLQAEALEMEQRVVSAEEVVERARAEAARRAGNVRAEVKEALLEAKRLKKEVDGHEVRKGKGARVLWFLLLWGFFSVFSCVFWLLWAFAFCSFGVFSPLTPSVVFIAFSQSIFYV